MRHRMLIVAAALSLATTSVLASTSADELWIIAAGRTPGAAGSNWVTDLFITNTSDESVEVELSFLEAGVVSKKTFDIDAGKTIAFPDIVSSTFNRQNATGAIHIDLIDDDADDFTPDGARLAAHARIYHLGDHGTLGQSLDGMPETEAISADAEVATAYVAGLANNTAFRSNWFGVNITEDEDGTPLKAEVLAELVDDGGEVIASKTYSMAPATPIFLSLSDLAPSFDNATLRVTMTEGEAIFGGSVIDSLTNDPTTLPASRKPAAQGEFTNDFLADGCTFTATGRNPFLPLTPGLKLTLEGEEDGEPAVNTIEVLSETKVVAGVTTRVVLETAKVDDEVVEVARDYMAECSQTGSVFYFGEDVDIYDEGKIVSHAGAWLAGTNGAKPGILMPGTVLAGARYFQELAPGVALDRSEHLETGVHVETEAGDFDGCLVTRETNALELQSAADLKVYCPGVGLVRDGALELARIEGRR